VLGVAAANGNRSSVLIAGFAALVAGAMSMAAGEYVSVHSQKDTEDAKRYNETWLVARHGYKTPARVREDQTMPRIAIDPTLAAALPLAA
jgi:hypothetical protein